LFHLGSFGFDSSMHFASFAIVGRIGRSNLPSKTEMHNVGGNVKKRPQ